MKEKLLIARNFFYKWFLVTFIIFSLGTVIYIFLNDYTALIAQNLFLVSPEYYYAKVFDYLSIAKLIIAIFVLSPGLALHWLLHCMEKKEEEQLKLNTLKKQLTLIKSQLFLYKYFHRIEDKSFALNNLNIDLLRLYLLFSQLVVWVGWQLWPQCNFYGFTFVMELHCAVNF